MRTIAGDRPRCVRPDNWASPPNSTPDDAPVEGEGPGVDEPEVVSAAAATGADPAAFGVPWPEQPVTAAVITARDAAADATRRRQLNTRDTRITFFTSYGSFRSRTFQAAGKRRLTAFFVDSL
ncbi:hypothetical protein [Streptomyces yunnanensis]|nr:hypothetical protein [Streptomyces yunnanensis]